MASSSPYISQCSPLRKQTNPSTLNLEQSPSKLQVQSSSSSVAFNSTQSCENPNSKMQHHPNLLENSFITSINNNSNLSLDPMCHQAQHIAYNYLHYTNNYNQFYNPNLAASSTLSANSSIPISITDQIMALLSSQNCSNISSLIHPTSNYYNSSSHGGLQSDQQICSVGNSPSSAKNFGNLPSPNSRTAHQPDNFMINSFNSQEIVSSAPTSAAAAPPAPSPCASAAAVDQPTSYNVSCSSAGSLVINAQEENATFQSGSCYWPGFDHQPLTLTSPAAAETEHHQFPSAASICEARAAIMASSGVQHKPRSPITSNSDAISNEDADQPAFSGANSGGNYGVFSDGANHECLRIVKTSNSDSEDNDMPGSAPPAPAVSTPVGGKTGGGNGRKRGRDASNSARVAHSDCADVIHVRARRGQATDSHSLAERVRRERISQRMKLLQELVPSCNKVLGKAAVLEEIINYVKSLQHQIEFLSMKLAASASSANFVRQLDQTNQYSQKRMCLIEPWVESQSFHGHSAP